MRRYPTQPERQDLIGRGKYLFKQIAKEFNATRYPTKKEAATRGWKGETFPVNHGRRIKKSDIVMAEQLWVNHVYNHCTNEIPDESKTSRCSIRETGGDRSRHLTKKMGKLVDAGIIYGSESEENEYGNQYEQEGARGYGFKPLMAPANKGFRFFWTPEFLTLVGEKMPEIYSLVVVPREEFAKDWICGPRCPLSPPPETKSHRYNNLSSDRDKNEKMRSEASPIGELIQEDLGLEKASPIGEQKQEAVGREDSIGRRKADKKFRAAAPKKSSRSELAFDITVEEMMDKKGAGATLTRKLLTSGQTLMANAIILVQLYLQKIAPLTGQTYHPSCVHTAIYRAMDLLAGYPTDKREHAFDEFRQTIDRISQRLERGGGFFVVTPDKWFDPDYQANIYMHYQHYLLPFRRRRAEMDEWQHMKDASKAQKKSQSDDWARTNDRYSGLAWSMKHYLKIHHKSDQRIHNANLLRWTAELRAMVRVDKVPYEEAVDVAKWLLTSKDSKAKWWRKSSCFNNGIRSPRSFRKHYSKIQGAYLETQHGSGINQQRYLN